MVAGSIFFAHNHHSATFASSFRPFARIEYRFRYLTGHHFTLVTAVGVDVIRNNRTRVRVLFGGASRLTNKRVPIRRSPMTRRGAKGLQTLQHGDGALGRGHFLLSSVEKMCTELNSGR